MNNELAKEHNLFLKSSSDMNNELAKEHNLFLKSSSDMNIELTKEQSDAFKRGESITLTPKPKQWEPRKGLYHNSNRFIAVSRTTVKAINEADKNISRYLRLLAYVDEFDGAWRDDSQPEFSLRLRIGEDRKWKLVRRASFFRIMGAVYMSKECGEGLIAKLESGEVVL